MIWRNTTIDNYYLQFFNLYKDKLTNLTNGIYKKGFNEEDIYGKSNKNLLASQYYLAFLQALLIYIEVQKGYETDWTYYEEKYNIETKTKNLACNGIDFNQILGIFGLPLTTQNTGVGIGFSQIENGFNIENYE